MNGIQEVSGSIPLISTIFKKKHNKNSFLNWKRVFVLRFTVAEIGWRWYNKANYARLQAAVAMDDDKTAKVGINIQKKPCRSPSVLIIKRTRLHKVNYNKILKPYSYSIALHCTSVKWRKM